jgi:hypothetical protein
LIGGDFMSRNFILHLYGKYNPNTLKHLTVLQNLEWFKEGKPTRLEYVNNAGWKGVKSVVLTGLTSPYSWLSIRDNINAILDVLNQEIGLTGVVNNGLISDSPLEPSEVYIYYKTLKNKTNRDWFPEIDNLTPQNEKDFFNKLKVLYYDINLEWLLTSEIRKMYKSYMDKTIPLPGHRLSVENKQYIEGFKSMMTNIGGDDVSIPKFVYDGTNIIYGRNHVSCRYTDIYMLKLEKPTIIKAMAFAACDSIKKVVIREDIGLKNEEDNYDDDGSFGESAFNDCSNLTIVEINNNMTYIPNKTFENCEALKQIVLPSTLRFIGSHSFRNCKSLINPDLLAETNLEIIGYAAFDSCKFEKLHLPETLHEIGKGAFANTYLKDITIPSNVYAIEEGAFYECRQLESVTYLGRELDEISKWCFAGCTTLWKIVLPKGLIIISDYAFEECSNLMKIEIPHGVVAVGNYVFKGCTGLAQIKFPDTVTKLGKCSFHKDVRVLCKKDSFIHKRAMKRKWNFELY